MNSLAELRGFLEAAPTEQSVPVFMINLVLAAVLASLIALAYVRFGRSFSDRRRFASTFVVLAITTLLIITVIKSSIALSLGLIGALSIVRYRAAIKEPEELAFLFIAISIGLGIGAGRGVTTAIAVIFIIIVLAIRSKLGQRSGQASMIFTINQTLDATTDSDALLKEIMTTLERHCTIVNLTRLDVTETALDASFSLCFKQVDQLVACKNALNALGVTHITFIDIDGLMA